MPSQDTDTRRTQPSLCQCQGIFQARRKGWLLVHSLPPGLTAAHHVQDTVWPLLLATPTIWLECQPRLFQARMYTILEGLPGMMSIADDVCVFNCNQANQNQNPIKFMERAADAGLVLNSGKCVIAKEKSTSLATSTQPMESHRTRANSEMSTTCRHPKQRRS